MRQNNRTGFQGVSYDRKRKKYRANSYLNGCQRHLGYFADPLDAGIVASDFRIQHAEDIHTASQEDRIKKSEAMIAWYQQHHKTSCFRGHPYDENNTYTRPDGKRECRACRIIRDGA